MYRLRHSVSSSRLIKYKLWPKWFVAEPECDRNVSKALWEREKIQSIAFGSSIVAPKRCTGHHVDSPVFLTMLTPFPHYVDSPFLTMLSPPFFHTMLTPPFFLTMLTPSFFLTMLTPPFFLTMLTPFPHSVRF